MGDEYLREDFDPVDSEIGRLPAGFDAALLDLLVDRRSWVLEVGIRCGIGLTSVLVGV